MFAERVLQLCSWFDKLTTNGNHKLTTNGNHKLTTNGNHKLITNVGYKFAEMGKM